MSSLKLSSERCKRWYYFWNLTPPLKLLLFCSGSCSNLGFVRLQVFEVKLFPPHPHLLLVNTAFLNVTWHRKISFFWSQDVDVRTINMCFTFSTFFLLFQFPGTNVVAQSNLTYICLDAVNLQFQPSIHVVHSMMRNPVICTKRKIYRNWKKQGNYSVDL